jgi:NhaP-type Na+/H+ or K+/H+ antiporter
VLAGGVQVGKPLEGGEEPVRFALTTEAGLNDGLAFPFIHLAILLAVAGGVVSADLLTHWSLKYVVWKIFAGVVGGMIAGWVVARLLFDWPHGNALARTEAGVVGIAAVLLTYGVTELAQGYGFIAAFVAGVMVRRGEWRHKFNVTLHSFTETTEQVLTAAILVALGAALPALWEFMDWRALVLAGALVFVIRPAAGLFALRGTDFPQKQRTVMAFYGIRGVGSVYYLAYASSHAPFDDVGLLWATMTAAIVASTLVHGLTASLAVEKAEDLPPEPERKEAEERAEEEGQAPRASA